MQTRPSRIARTRSSSKPVAKSWAEQHAPLAQVIGAYSTLVAVIVAGLGYWYTVVPLYQKAAVDEQLAQREAELKKLDQELAIARRQAYELVRGSLMEQAALRASSTCTFYIKQVDATPLDHIARELTPCLLSASESIVASQRLSEEDGRHLLQKTKELGANLDQRRMVVVEKIASVISMEHSELAKVVPESALEGALLAHSEEARKFLAKIEPFLSPEDRLERQRRRNEDDIHLARTRLANEFGGEAYRDVVRFYRSDVWPAVKLAE